MEHLKELPSRHPIVVHALHGLGGIGKSTLAAHYAASRIGECNPIWWITADSPAAIEAGLADLGLALQPELARVMPAEALIERAVQWLGCHDGWLLVLDNVTHPSHIAPLCARLSSGHILITSRLATGWHAVTPNVLRLGVLTHNEAIELLTQIVTLGNPSADLNGAGELCERLGYLPLAIEQAAGYIHQTAITPYAYISLLNADPAMIYAQPSEGGDAQRTMARIWRVTLDKLADTPLAGDLLRIMAWYSHQDIPRFLVNKNTTPSLVHHAIGRLAAYNMVLASQDGSLSVHSLVQAIARTPDPNDPHRMADKIHDARDQAIRQLATAAVAHTPMSPTEWPMWRSLLPHISAFTSYVGSDMDTTAMAHLMNQAGVFLQTQGAISLSIAFLERAHTGFMKNLGPDHPNTITSKSNLAGAYRTAGDLQRAIPLLEQTLTENERALGIDHPSLITSRNNLADTYRLAGDVERAIQLLAQTLADSERLLGPRHPNTLTIRNNLASAYQAAREPQRAIPMLEKSIIEGEQILPRDHPYMLALRSNLGSAYREVGDTEQAIPLLVATLADGEKALGPEHPDTLTMRNNLAVAYQLAGDLNRAVVLLQETLDGRKRTLGHDHPSTLASYNNLGNALYKAGDAQRAVPLLEHALAGNEKSLGSMHRTTMASRNNLANAHRAAGNLERSILLYEETLVCSEQALGADHPSTLAVRDNLADARTAHAAPDSSDRSPASVDDADSDDMTAHTGTSGGSLDANGPS
ncbi:tetratricopeptide repeat protein [Nonomuraea jabiensis]|uniref:tetratricopeptide repeat protein n=1 Tax=Nonomuraea jabiensis TaxID=882448 RepID=UPI00368D3E35